MEKKNAKFGPTDERIVTTNVPSGNIQTRKKKMVHARYTRSTRSIPNQRNEMYMVFGASMSRHSVLNEIELMPCFDGSQCPTKSIKPALSV